ncbi:hypothetical protein ACOYR1_16485 [Thalassotalea piscium]
MMEQNKVERLNDLFEKMVSDNANNFEEMELKNLYQEFINDGRQIKSQKCE